MDISELKRFVEKRWTDDLVPRLVDYVRVPALSPLFDPSWAAHGHLERVIRDACAWCEAQGIVGAKFEIIALEGLTPCLFFDIPATGGLGNDDTVLFYGHLDKQPEMEGWREDLGPWKPVIENGRLFGRGAADDGYAIYAALTVIAGLDQQAVPRCRCVGLKPPKRAAVLICNPICRRWPHDSARSNWSLGSTAVVAIMTSFGLLLRCAVWSVAC